MILKRFYDESLAQATYLLACEKTREAIVVDPGLEFADYQRAASAERVQIVHVTETHIHADFVSGARELAERAGAILHLSAEGGDVWGYTPVAMKAARPLRAGSKIQLGTVTLEAVHTPGHTPEHITFVVIDRERGDEPVGAATGDFIFVGDVGRPDLLELSAGLIGSAERSAAELFRSIQDFKARPDHLQLWPGHGAGSACGKSLGSLPHTTLGYERLFNWAFADLDEREFIRRALEHQPVPPRYFSEMKKLNRRSAELPPPLARALVDAAGLHSALANEATVVDTRPADRYAKAHVPGTLNIPLGKSFLNWMGALVPYDRDLILIFAGEPDSEVEAAGHELRKIGLTRVSGFAGEDVVGAWARKHGGPREQRQLDVRSLATRSGDGSLQIIDVRAPDEWAAGHLPGALHIPLAALPDRIGEIDADSPVAVHCKGGGRSAIAASFLEAKGIDGVANLAGGFDAWAASKLPVEREP